MISMDNSYPDFATYCDNIGVDYNINYLDKMKLDALVSRSNGIKQTCKYLMNTQLSMLNKGMLLDGSSTSAVRKMFITAGLPESLFKSYKNKSGFSFDAEVQQKVREYIETTDLYNDSQINIMNYMAMLKDAGTAESVLTSLKRGMSDGKITDSDMRTYDGRPLYEMSNYYVRQSTGRYYAREMPLVGLPLGVRQCITVPNKYLLLCFDLKQSDIRILYNIFLRGALKQDDEIFDEAKDKYWALYQIIMQHSNLPTDETSFLENRGSYKTAILAGMYFAREAKLSTLTGDTDFAKAEREYFDNHQGYKYIIAKIKRLYDLDVVFQVRDFFGFEIDMENVGEKDGDRLSFEEVVKYVISRTTQSATNSILIKWVNYVIDKLRSEGIDESLFQVSSIRHDEADFTVHSKVLDKLDSLFNATVIRVSGWGDIGFDIDVYIHYQDEEPSFANEDDILRGYRETVAKYSEKTYPVLPIGEPFKNRMIPNVHEIYCFSIETPMELYESIGMERLTGKKSAETNEIAVEEINREALNDNLPQEFKMYKQYYSTFVIKNVVSGQMRKFCNIEHIQQIIEALHLGYVKAVTISGTGLAIINDATVLQDNTNVAEVIEVFRGLDSIKEATNGN